MAEADGDGRLAFDCFSALLLLCTALLGECLKPGSMDSVACPLLDFMVCVVPAISLKEQALVWCACIPSRSCLRPSRHERTTASH